MGSHTRETESGARQVPWGPLSPMALCEGAGPLRSTKPALDGVWRAPDEKELDILGRYFHPAWGADESPFSAVGIFLFQGSIIFSSFNRVYVFNAIRFLFYISNMPGKVIFSPNMNRYSE